MRERKARRRIPTRKEKRARRSIVIKRLANFSFLYLIFFTIHFSMITLSKYTGTVTGTGSSSVAKWDISVNNQISSKSISLVAGNGSQEYRIRVTSNSEVASTYSIVLSNIPNDLTVSLDGGTPETLSNNSITFSDVGSFQAGNSNVVNEHVLTFYAPIQSSAVTNGSVQLDVVFVQDQL